MLASSMKSYPFEETIREPRAGDEETTVSEVSMRIRIRLQKEKMNWSLTEKKNLLMEL